VHLNTVLNWDWKSPDPQAAAVAPERRFGAPRRRKSLRYVRGHPVRGSGDFSSRPALPAQISDQGQCQDAPGKPQAEWVT